MNSKLILILVISVAFFGSLMATPVILDSMDLSGEVGVKYHFWSNDNYSSGDISVSNFDLGLTIEPVDMISAYLGLIYSDEMESLVVDEAYAKVRLIEEYSFDLTVGSFYQPTSIALDYSSFISYPFTYTFTELSEVALMGEAIWENFTFKTSIFKADDSFDNDSNLDTIVLNVATDNEIENGDFLISASYISNLSNLSYVSDDEIGAISLGSTVNWKDYSFIGEFVMTLDEVNDEKPSVIYTEVSYLLRKNLIIAGNYTLTQNAQDLFSESVIGAVVNYTFMENDFSDATIGTEYLINTDYDENVQHNLAVKLSLEF